MAASAILLLNNRDVIKLQIILCYPTSQRQQVARVSGLDLFSFLEEFFFSHSPIKMSATKKPSRCEAEGECWLWIYSFFACNVQHSKRRSLP